MLVEKRPPSRCTSINCLYNVQRRFSKSQYLKFSTDKCFAVITINAKASIKLITNNKYEVKISNLSVCFWSGYLVLNT